MSFQKLKPKVITSRNYKNLDNDKFQTDIKTCRFDKNYINSFKEAVLPVFNKYVPIKKKYIRANEAHFMPKTCIKKSRKCTT